MEDFLFEKIITSLFPASASLLLSVLFGIGLFKYLKDKYIPLYYRIDVDDVLTGFCFIVSFFCFMFLNINLGDYSTSIVLYFIPDLSANIILLNIASLFVRAAFSSIAEVGVYLVCWGIFKRKILE